MRDGFANQCGFESLRDMLGRARRLVNDRVRHRTTSRPATSAKCSLLIQKGKASFLSTFAKAKKTASKAQLSIKQTVILALKLDGPRKTETYRQKQDSCIFGPNSG